MPVENEADEWPPTPRRNPDLIGHETAEKRFLDAWNTERCPHAWMIAGTRGIGKATLAFRIARFVLSGGGPTDGLFGTQPAETLHLDPDDPVFRRVAAGGHADLMTLERTENPDSGKMRNVVVDDVRKAGRFLGLTPGEGGWRVLVVDNADEMNINAANALLKMLEEPPERVLILLVCHAPGRLLATVRSRCCRLSLHPLAEDAVVGLIENYLPDLAHEDALALARLGEGSIGHALELAAAGGLDLYREMVSLMAPLPELDTAALYGFSDSLVHKGGEDAFRTATGLIGWWLARMIRHGAAGSGWPAAVVPEEEGCAARLFATAGLDRWLEVWDKTNRLIAQAEGLNLDRKQVVINLFSTLEGAARA